MSRIQTTGNRIPRKLVIEERALDPTRRICLIAGAACLTLAAGAQAQSKTTALDLSQYRGKVVYLDFWASWCGPCQLSFPYMEQLARLHPAADFALIAINVDHSRDKAESFLKRFGGSVPVTFDGDGKIASQFGVKEMPTSMLIGRDGRTRFVHAGFFANQIPTYDAHISELLHEK
jgi:thiol-disulfide isomerase/thioredoxin